jgi:hypothetical protein
MGSKICSYGTEHKQLYTTDGRKATHHINKMTGYSDEQILMMAHNKAFITIYQYFVNELILIQNKAYELK